jgi:hypothetical protein
MHKKNNVNPMKFDSFDSFYPFYLEEHSNITNRQLHFVGTTLAILSLSMYLIT